MGVELRESSPVQSSLMSIIEPEVRSLDPCFMNISYHTINTIIITPTLKRTKQRHRKSLPSANSQVTSQSHRARKSQKSPTSAFGTLIATMEASPLRRMLPWMFFPADHPIIQAISVDDNQKLFRSAELPAS